MREDGVPIVMEYARLPMLPELSVAWIVNPEAPLPLGVPVIAPVFALSERPAGSVPATTA